MTDRDPLDVLETLDVSDVTFEPFSLSLAAPLSTARGQITEREGFVVRVDLDGAAGRGEATPLQGWTESLSACRRALERVARSPGLDRSALAETPAARHGVELAVADARASARDEPLYRYLGATGRVETVPVNATVGDGPPEETASEAREAVHSGFGAVKVKVGARSLEADLERVEAVRETCPDVELRLDANGAWERATAREALERVAPFDVAYVEQPLPADDLAGHATLRGRGVGIALDESLTAHPVEAVLAAEAADVLVLKPVALGGPHRAVALARRAREAGVESVVTTTVDGAYARTGAVHVAAALPDPPACGLATGDLLAEDLLETDPAPVEAGVARVPQGPGLLGDRR